MSDQATIKHVPKPDLPPPPSTVGLVGWLRQNLFSSTGNIIITVVTLGILVQVIPTILDWAIFSADWAGSSYDDCESDGACWVFVGEKIDFFIYGFYPAEEYWRVNIFWLLIFATFLPQFFDAVPANVKKWLGIWAVTGLPLFAAFLLVGNVFGLALVETQYWGGFTLNVVLAFVGIVAALPIGILLALGRRSKMPAIRSICVGFIEVFRGVPLITILFMASVMLPLFLPSDVGNIDKVVRAMVGIILFQSAYMAEVIRGGLQAIPKGQYEAADALGLSYGKKMVFIILPQALKIVIPGIVNTFIALFKDTTLVLIIGLMDIVNAVKATTSDPAWGNVATEGYVFAGLCFWVFCFGMSYYSQNLEKKLNTSHR